MYNLMLRYSGETIHPYIGAGVGSSTGILYNANIQSGNVGSRGHRGISRLPTNFSVGLRAFVTKKLFLFGEYKYFVTNYSWGSESASTQRVKLRFSRRISCPAASDGPFELT